MIYVDSIGKKNMTSTKNNNFNVKHISKYTFVCVRVETAVVNKNALVLNFWEPEFKITVWSIEDVFFVLFVHLIFRWAG